MAATKIGVVYSINQARCRRIIVPDDDSQLVLFQNTLSDGEAMLTYDASLGFDTGTVTDQIRKVTGRDPDDDSCAVVDATGTVVDVVKADASIDVHPDGVVIPASQDITVGCMYDANVNAFITPVSIIKSGTVLKDGTVVKTDIAIGGTEIPATASAVSIINSKLNIGIIKVVV